MDRKSKQKKEDEFNPLTSWRTHRVTTAVKHKVKVAEIILENQATSVSSPSVKEIIEAQKMVRPEKMRDDIMRECVLKP